MNLKITLGGSRPIYRQIIDHIRQGVTSGQLEVGDPLPSVRQLAEELVVNHNTVAKAFSELVREGTLESRHGRGVFVAERRSVFTAAEKKRRLSNALDTFLSEVLVLDIPPEKIQRELESRLESLSAAKK